MTGQSVSHYLVLEKLGEGGMGAVYKARDTRLDRLVALKFLPAEKLADPERKARFAQEARAASALNHPNIITIHDIGEDFIVMEYVAGKTLDQVIPRKGMRLGEALKIAVQMADTLAKAHAAGIVHRDLKPGNVMVTEDGLVKVLDFGLAKLTEGWGQAALSTEGQGGLSPSGAPAEDQPTRTVKPQTQEGAIVGTVGYMSPEQAQGRPVDARSDIFSFGSLLYEMVTGQRAFRGESNLSTLAAILNKEPAPLPAGTPHDLEKVITRCLRKDPARRWQYMADLKVALEELKEESDSGTLAATEARFAARPQRRRWLGAAAGAAAVILALTGWVLLQQLTRPASAMRPVPLTSYPGDEIGPSFSPDGNLVAFHWSGPNQDNVDVYLLQLGSQTPLRLTTHPDNDVLPSWSPDGRQIVFVRGVAGKWEILVMRSLGGPERRVAGLASVSPTPFWSPDGRFLTVGDRSSPGEPESIYLVSVETGEKRRLSEPLTGSVGDYLGRIAPDGKALLFGRMTALLIMDLHLLPLAEGYVPSGEVRRLTSDDAMIWSFDWTPDGRSVVFASTRQGGMALWRMPYPSSAAPERLPVAGEGVSSLSIAPRGNRLVYSGATWDSNIWRLDRASGEAPRQLIASTRQDMRPQFSPDGKRIAFVSDRTGNWEVWICDNEGRSPVQVTRYGGKATLVDHPRWSPDGRWIAFVANEGGRWHSYVIGARGGSPRRVTTDPSEDGAPGWSQDGRWIYFTTRDQIWKAPAEGGAPIQVTYGGGLGAIESADGKHLYYAKDYDMATLMPWRPNSVWRVPVEGGEEVQVLPAIFTWANFAVTREGIYFNPPPAGAGQSIHPGAAGHSLDFYEFATRKTRQIAALPKPPALGLSVSDDGRTILYAQYDVQSTDLTVVENFR